MKILLLGWLPFLLLAGGCLYQGMPIDDPSEQIEFEAIEAGTNRTVTIPVALEDPDKAKEVKAPVPQPEVKKEQKVTVEKKVLPVEKKVLPVEKERRKSRSPRSPEHYRRGPGIWRAFSRLSPSEQEELLKLQRSDPEKFRAVMQEKADQLYAAEKKRQQELDELVISYRKESDPAKKEAVKKELRAKIHEDFLQRLQDTRRDIESNKRRTAMMERELQKREKNCEAIVDALLEHRLAPKEDSVPQKTEK